MLGILKWGVAQIWWCGASQLQSKQKVALNVYLSYKQKAGLKNQEWRGLETPIHYWSLDLI